MARQTALNPAHGQLRVRGLSFSLGAHLGVRLGPADVENMHTRTCCSFSRRIKILNPDGPCKAWQKPLLTVVLTAGYDMKPDRK